MKRCAIALCLWVLAPMTPALAQVADIPSSAPATAQEIPQRWEYRVVTNTTHISGVIWEEDGERIGAPASGWLNARGAEGWELFDVEVVAGRDTFGNPYTHRYFYFRRVVRTGD